MVKSTTNNEQLLITFEI